MKNKKLFVVLTILVLFCLCFFIPSSKNIELAFNENVSDPRDYMMYESVRNGGYKIRTVLYGQDGDWLNPKKGEEYEVEFELIPTLLRRFPGNTDKYNITVNGNKPVKVYYNRPADLSDGFTLRRKVLVVKYSFSISDDITNTMQTPDNVDVDSVFTWQDYQKYAEKNRIPDYKNNICNYFNVYYNTNIDRELDFVVSNGSNETFDYTVFKNNKAVITEYKGNSSEVIIPNQIDGYDIVGITAYIADQDSVLQTDFKVKKVTVQEGVQFIGKGVFSKCVALTEINMPESLLGIGNEAFAYCRSLQSVNLPGKLKCIDTGAFSNCKKLKLSSIPESVEFISSYAFDSCNAITELNLPGNLTQLYGYTFVDCKNLLKINVSNKTINMSKSDFEGTKVEAE